MVELPHDQLAMNKSIRRDNSEDYDILMWLLVCLIVPFVDFCVGFSRGQNEMWRIVSGVICASGTLNKPSLGAWVGMISQDYMRIIKL